MSSVEKEDCLSESIWSAAETEWPSIIVFVLPGSAVVFSIT